MKNNYWRSNLKILSILLGIWFIVSFGFGIILSDFLDQFQIGGFKLGFWFAQQGSIYFFVLLTFIYIFLMNKLDQKYKDNNEEDH
jgi:putative solute:sodium symporter small subunit